ncbi:MAG: hypothetical protein AAF679_14275 [Pseudomonadota bacterium]
MTVLLEQTWRTISSGTWWLGALALLLWQSLDLWGLAAGAGAFAVSLALDLWGRARRHRMVWALVPVPACLGVALLMVASAATWMDRPLMRPTYDEAAIRNTLEIVEMGSGQFDYLSSQSLTPGASLYEGFVRTLPNED